MLKSIVKRLEGVKWVPVPAKEFVGTSIAQYMNKTDDRVIAALFDDDKQVFFLINNLLDKEKYQEKAFTMHISDFLYVFEAECLPEIAIKVFPDAFFERVEVEPETKTKDKKQWW